MALAMHAAFRGQGLLRTVVLVPWAVLTVVTAMMWRSIFDPTLGIVNTILGTDTVWLGQSPQAMIVMIIADTWKTAPFMALLLLAGLQVIPGEIYEAAKVDGATMWQRFRSITLPLLMPALLVALIFRTLDALRIFDLPFVLTKGAHNTNTLSLEAYQTFTANNIIGLGAALAVLTFLIVMTVSFLYIRFVGGNIRGMAEEGMMATAAAPPVAAEKRTARKRTGRPGRRRRGGCGWPSRRSWSSASRRSTGWSTSR